MGAMVENAAIWPEISAFEGRSWIALSPGAG
jgi:hypothetical protein